MKRSSLITLAIVALVALLAVPFIYAQPGPGPRGPRGMDMRGPGGPGGPGLFMHLQKLQTELGLSDAQVTEIKTIFTNLRDQDAQYRDQLKGSMRSITDTLIKDPNNVAAAQAMLDQQAQAEHAIRTNLVNATANALKVLTPEQRAKLADLIAQRQANRANRMGH